jgi:hypothetical protein
VIVTPFNPPHESAPLPPEVLGIGILFVAVVLYMVLWSRGPSEQKAVPSNGAPPKPPPWPIEKGDVRVVSRDEQNLKASIRVREIDVSAVLFLGASHPPRLRFVTEIGPTSAFPAFECEARGPFVDDTDTFSVDHVDANRRFIFRGDRVAFQRLCGVDALLAADRSCPEILRLTWDGRSKMSAAYTLTSFADTEAKDAALLHFVGLAERVPREAYRGRS